VSVSPAAGEAGSPVVVHGGPMLLAYDYPLLGILLSTLMFFIWVMWLIVLFYVFADVFRSRDLRGFSKCLWLVFIVFLPIIGTLAYVLARGDSMNERATARAEARDAQFKSYVQETAGPAVAADQLAQLASLHEAGTLTDAEYEAWKAKVLAS
jgi:signal transduction histidine kinase